ncbi:MAG TPA: GAP family protein [Micromonosporaceae bacterium]|jgi:threonine/homoserine/homoserine lactone efflux protein|nr:GAP family protein [Micromonosporaceae bacterium]
MGAVIGDVLALAVGVAISPLPIVAVILVLLAPRAGATSAGFLGGWVVGIIVGTTVVTIIADAAGLSTAGGGSTAAGVVKIVSGTALVLLAVRQWRHRPQGDAEPPMPKWLTAIESVTPAKAAGLGLVLAVANPKNLLLILGAGVAIGSANLPVGRIVVTVAVFTVVAAISVAAPVIAYRLDRQRASAWLTGLKTWLVANNATVMVVLLLVIGVVLIGKGIGAL